MFGLRDYGAETLAAGAGSEPVGEAAEGGFWGRGFDGGADGLQFRPHLQTGVARGNYLELCLVQMQTFL